MAARRSPPDAVAAASRALREFLLALELPVDVDPELAGTPERAARAWCDELLEGYRHDPADVLADALPSDERGLVAVTDIDYASVCPHHLLPAWGVAHVAYLPGGRIVGLGALVKLVDALSRRLVLQETLGRQVAEALVTHLGARAAGVSLDARHACLCARGERRGEARAVTHGFAGAWRDDVRAREEFFAAVRPRGGAR